MYHVIALLLAAAAIVLGYRRGFARQLPQVIGVAFGAVASHIFRFPVAEEIYKLIPALEGTVQRQFVSELMAVTIIFVLIFAIFSIITSFLGKALERSERSVLNNIGGAIFLLFESLLFLSLAYNLILAGNINSSLLKVMKSDDGNIVEEVMMIAPTVLGNQGADELAHRVQLEEAKRIS